MNTERGLENHIHLEEADHIQDYRVACKTHGATLEIMPESHGRHHIVVVTNTQSGYNRICELASRLREERQISLNEVEGLDT